MQLVSFKRGEDSSYGAIFGDGIIDLGARLGTDVPTLRALLATGVQRARPIVESASDPDLAFDATELLPPITDPGAIWCAGLNTHSHFVEVSELMGVPELPAIPIMFLRATNTVVGSGTPIERPIGEPLFDYEGEIAVVIGSRCRNVSVDEAMNHVAGFTCFNDVTARANQIASPRGTTGKNAYRSGSCGPWISTIDEVSLDDLGLVTRVNGETRQEMGLDDLIFGFAELIAYLSEVTWLEPGDIIATGSPEGNGVLSTPQAVLQPGDTVEVEVHGVGTLTNTVIDQPS